MPTHTLCRPDSKASLSSAFAFPNHQQISTYRPLAHICTAFIQHLFERGPESTPFFVPDMYSQLPFLIAHVLSHSPLDPSTIFATLSLLYRYRSRCQYRHIKLRDPSRLFITAYVVTAKLLSDKSYSMRTWSSLAQNNYDIHELMGMEREFCSTLDWVLGFNVEVLGTLKTIIDAFLSPDIETYFRTPLPLTTSKVSQAVLKSHSDGGPSQLSHELNDDEEWVWTGEDFEGPGGDVAGLDREKIIEIGHQFEHTVQAQSPIQYPPTGYKPVKPVKLTMVKRLSNIFS